MQKRFEELEFRCKRVESQRKELENQCKKLKSRCEALEAKLGPQLPCLEIDAPMMWNLFSYDFAGFWKGDHQLSDKFQLGSTGVNAQLCLYPKGRRFCSLQGKAALFLRVDKPVTVKWTWQSGGGEVKTSERDFSQELCSDGTPAGWGDEDFMPISEANGSITLRILSVQLPGSTLCFS